MLGVRRSLPAWSSLSSGEDRKSTQVYIIWCDKCHDRRDDRARQAHGSSGQGQYERLPRGDGICIKTLRSPSEGTKRESERDRNFLGKSISAY